MQTKVKYMKPLLLLIAVLLSSLLSHAQQDLAKEKVAELITLNGELETLLSIIDRGIFVYKHLFKNVPDQYWEERHRQLSKTYSFPIKNRLIDIYVENLPEEEISSSLKRIKQGKTIKSTNTYKNIEQQISVYVNTLVTEMSQVLSEELEESEYFVSNIDEKGCDQFKNGIFKILMMDGSELQIEKKKNVQYSYTETGTYVKFELDYFNECNYKMTVLETDIEGYKGDIGNTIEIYPYYVDEKSMKYKSTDLSKGGFIWYGELLIK